MTVILSKKRSRFIGHITRCDSLKMIKFCSANTWPTVITGNNMEVCKDQLRMEGAKINLWTNKRAKKMGDKDEQRTNRKIR